MNHGVESLAFPIAIGREDTLAMLRQLAEKAGIHSPIVMGAMATSKGITMSLKGGYITVPWAPEEEPDLPDDTVVQ